MRDSLLHIHITCIFPILQLRGAGIKYREYISVGKGRDMGFDSINAFELKTSSGASNILISRDLWRLATRFDLFRCLHFYYSGCGCDVAYY